MPSAKSHAKDIFGFEMISQNIFTTAQIDRNVWTREMLDRLTDFIRKDPKCEKYRDLDWSAEYALADREASDSGSSDFTQTAL